jgi:hypothetical protein
MTATEGPRQAGRLGHPQARSPSPCSLLRSSDGPEIRRLLAGGKPYAEGAVERVIEIVRRGGHVDAALGEAERRMDASMEAVAALPQSEVTRVFTRLGEYLVDRVAVARQN